MRWKKIAKVCLITGLVTAGLGLAAFSTLVYNPFEGRLDEVRKAVPANLDFWVTKAGLDDDFDRFPEPRFWSSFEGASWAPRFRTTGMFKSAEAAVRPLLESIDRLEDQLGQVPLISVDILGDAIGKDVVIAGKRRPSGVFDVVAYSRVSWKLRAAIGLLAYGFVRSKLQGLSVEEEGGIYHLTGNGGELWLTRVLDVAIAGNSKDLVTRSRDLALDQSEEDSLYASADYNDQLVAPLDDWSTRTQQVPNAVTSMIDMSMLRKHSPEFATWPPQDASIEARLVDMFITQQAMRRLWASVIFEEHAALSLVARLGVNNGELSPFQKRFHAEPPGSVENWLRTILGYVPQTAAMAAVLRAPPGQFMSELFRILDRDAQDVIQQAMRENGVKRGVYGLIDRVAPGLEPWVGIIFRNNDYKRLRIEYEAIPSPAPAWALMFRATRGQAVRVQNLITLFRDQLRPALGFSQKTTRMSAGVGNEVKIEEFGNPQIPATGQIALYFDGEGPRRYFIVSNSGKLMTEIINTRYTRGGMRPLISNSVVRETVDQLPSQVSGFAWVQGDRCRNVVARYHQFMRNQMNSDVFDAGWAMDVRPGVERAVFDQHFRGRYRNKAQLRGGDATKFDQLVTRRLSEMWQRERTRLGKDLDRDFSEAGAILEYLDAACFVLRARPKDLWLEARLFFQW